MKAYINTQTDLPILLVESEDEAAFLYHYFNCPDIVPFNTYYENHKIPDKIAEQSFPVHNSYAGLVGSKYD